MSRWKLISGTRSLDYEEHYDDEAKAHAAFKAEASCRSVDYAELYAHVPIQGWKLIRCEDRR